MSKTFHFPNAAAFAAMPPDEFETFWQTFVAMGMDKQSPWRGRFFIGRHDVRDICILHRAGWAPAFENPLSQLMAWYWRRPARTKHRPGMLFHSTNQAISQLRKEQMNAVGVSTYQIEYKVLGLALNGTIQAKGPLHANELADRLNGEVVVRS